MVCELDVDALMLTEPVGGREARQAEADDVEGDVGGIEGEGAGAS
jgi:hypothetical protein